MAQVVKTFQSGEKELIFYPVSPTAWFLQRMVLKGVVSPVKVLIHIS